MCVFEKKKQMQIRVCIHQKNVFEIIGTNAFQILTFDLLRIIIKLLDTAFRNEGERKENQKNKPYYICIHIYERNDHNMFSQKLARCLTILSFFTLLLLFYILLLLSSPST
jgi:hypothetical protein